MEIIPLIEIKDKKTNADEKKLLEEIKEEKPAYILDKDGINKNKPNVSIYQRLAKKIDQLWIDNGPKNLGDIVDSILAGGTNITIRQNKWPYLDISYIKEVTENKIFLAFEKEKSYPNISSYDVDGYIYFNTKKDIQNNFKQKHFLKTSIQKKETYTYETNKKNIKYWEKIGVDGLVVDINNIKEFRER